MAQTVGGNGSPQRYLAGNVEGGWCRHVSNSAVYHKPFSTTDIHLAIFGAAFIFPACCFSLVLFQNAVQCREGKLEDLSRIGFSILSIKLVKGFGIHDLFVLECHVGNLWKTEAKTGVSHGAFKLIKSRIREALFPIQWRDFSSIVYFAPKSRLKQPSNAFCNR